MSNEEIEEYFSSLKTEVKEKVDFEGKDVCILPYGGSVVPLLQD